MKTTILTKVSLVRAGFTDESVWRAALGNAEPLRCFAASIDSLDAPDWMPAGGMRSTNCPSREPLPISAWR